MEPDVRRGAPPQHGLTPWLPFAAILYLARNATQNASGPVVGAFLMGLAAPAERASAVLGVSFRLPFAVTTPSGPR